MIIKHIHEAVIEEDTAYLFMGMEVREVFMTIFTLFCLGRSGWNSVWLSERTAI